MTKEFEYKDLYEAAPVGLWRTNVNDGKFIHANEAAVYILGFSNFEELSNYLSKDLYDPLIRQDLIKELEKVNEIKDLQVTMKRKDGKEITVSLSAKLNTEKGFIEGTIKDVTDIISLEASALIPHLEKISLLKQSIIDKIKQSESSLHTISKTA